MTLASGFSQIFVRELDHLTREIEAYENEADLWVVHGDQKNPPGTLALHVVGNLMHFIGAGLGRTGYVRDREAEFAEVGVPRAEILSRLTECRHTVVAVLDSLDDESLSDAYPGVPPGHMVGATTQALLAHLLWHLGWHLGHVFYHRLARTSG